VKKIQIPAREEGVTLKQSLADPTAFKKGREEILSPHRRTLLNGRTTLQRRRKKNDDRQRPKGKRSKTKNDVEFREKKNMIGASKGARRKEGGGIRTKRKMKNGEKRKNHHRGTEKRGTFSEDIAKNS